MGFKCGIVGLPNVGKSTLFNSLTTAGIAAANYPFCTIEPNVGVVPVPDTRLTELAAIIKPQQTIPTSMNFVDIAGLVAGAAEGEGLGNKFLAHIREVNAIAHVVRCFINDDVTHVSGKVSPADDIAIINTELALADLDTLEKAINRIQKQAKSGDKQAKAELAVFEKLKAALDQGNAAREVELSQEERQLAKPLCLITAKPVLYIANVDDSGFNDNPLLDTVTNIAGQENAVVVPICAAIEAELAELSAEDKQAFLADMGLKEPGLDRLIRAGHELLGLQTYFTAGPKEVRAWTVKKGATAPEAAGVIHTDFEKGFIRAEVIAFADYIKFNGEQGAKEAGRLRLEGKDYIVQDGDVMHFRFNV